MKAHLRWNKTGAYALVQNLDDAGPPWLGCIVHQAQLNQYAATSAQYEKPRDLGVYATAEEAQRAVELDAVSFAGRRAYAVQFAQERRERRARALAA